MKNRDLIFDMNCHVLYSNACEKEIKKKIYGKMKVKIKQIELEKAKKEYEKLLAETKS